MADLFSMRVATPQDIPLIHQFICELAEFEKLLDTVKTTQADLKDTLFSSTPCAEVMLGFEGETPIGFALYFQTFSTFEGRPGLYLEDLYIQPPYRSKGYGKRFLACLAQIALERGYARFEWSVLNWNESAIRFYESLGAKPMDEWTVYRMDRPAMAALSNDKTQRAQPVL